MLDWTIFAGLPGPADRNFEIVTRAAVKHAYGRYGRLRGTRQQPGVEYYLRMEQEGCPLGDPPRVFGWQCRYYGDEGHLDTNRRRRVRKAIKTAIANVEGLTDFVLWTRLALRDVDTTWLEEQGDDLGVTCHGWHQDDLEGMLIGDAASLRQRFFGDLVVTREQLLARYEETLAQVHDRYERELHLPRVGDRELRSVLAEPGALAAEVRRHGTREQWQAALDDLQSNAVELGADPAELLELADANQSQIKLLGEAHEFVAAAQIDDFKEAVDDLLDDERVKQIAALLDRLRDRSSGPLRSAVDVVADAFVASSDALYRVAASVSMRLIAVNGLAGVGKTHLAADLAQPTDERPPGVLVLARRFGPYITEQDLAGALLPRQTDLDRALDGLQDAAARAGCRLPIVIDGLSESDQPADWHDLLASLGEKLRRRPMLAVVVTVRPDYAERCLPEQTPHRTLFPFTPAETQAAVRKYFKFFKIHAETASLPWLELTNPLFLRIFCLAVNSDRRATVTVSQLPTGLAEVFELFLKNSIRRIADAHGFDRSAARDRVRDLAEALWEQNTRALSQPEVKALLGDAPMAWPGTLTSELLSEGVLRREPARHDGPAEMITFVFDAFAGHTIGEALPSRQTLAFDAPDLVARLDAAQPDAHPFAEDVVAGLDSMYASRGGELIWSRTSSPAVRSMSLIHAAQLPGAQISSETVDEVVALINAEPMKLSSLLQRIIDLHSWPDEPFNADLLDRLLLPMSVWQRDLIWTEWLRADDALIDAIVAHWTETFQTQPAPDEEVARLGVAFLSWCLTSTDRATRDRATEALWWAGRAFPEILFASTIGGLSINDPYVSERLLAASYGVAMANARLGDAYAAAAPAMLSTLVDQLLRAEEAVANSHWLIREHARGIFDLALQHQQDLVPESITEADLQAIPVGPAPSPLNDDQAQEADEVLSMDFGNYTIGPLSPGRANYDDSHEDHQRITAEILARVWDLGWRRDRFAGIDRELGGGAFSRDNDPAKVERYGKKYSWIGFYEAAGREDAAGKLCEQYGERAGERERLTDVPIDPSFPRVLERAPAQVSSWIDGPADDEQWVIEATTEMPDSLLRVARIGDQHGPWIAAYGDLHQGQDGSSDENRRRVFALIRLTLVSRGSWPEVAEWLNNRSSLDRSVLPSEGEDYYTYAGEIPWAAHFAPYLGTRAARERTIESIRVSDTREIQGECLAHAYAWESYHSVTNEDGGFSVPSPAFSEAFGLLTAPGSLDQILPDGTPASRTVRAPAGFEGQMLYLREDLLRRYANDSDADVGLLAWGERNVMLGDHRNAPQRMIDARRSGADVHRRVLALADLI